MRSALLAVAIVGALAAPAGARVRLVDDGAVAGSRYEIVAATDGRYVVRVLDDGRLVALDTAAGTRREIPHPARCAFTAVGAGSALFACVPDSGDDGRLVDLGSGAIAALPAIPDHAEHLQYDGVGARWLSIVFGGNHYFGREYLDRVTGVLRRAPAALDRVVDLDAPGLYRRLCHPVVRPAPPTSPDSFAFAPTLALRDGAAAISTVTEENIHGRVILERCGRRPRVIGRTDSGDPPLLAGGQVIWVDGTALRARSLATGRVRTLRVDRATGLVGVAGGRVYLTEHRRLKHVIV